MCIFIYLYICPYVYIYTEVTEAKVMQNGQGYKQLDERVTENGKVTRRIREVCFYKLENGEQ